MARIPSTQRHRQPAVLVATIILVLAPVASERMAAQSPRYHATPLVAAYSWALDINEAGHVVGGLYLRGFQAHAFRSQDGRVDDLGDRMDLATAINGADQVVGLNAVWRDGDFVDFGMGGGLAFAYGVNDSGQVVGAYY